MGRSRRVAVDGTTFENGGIEWTDRSAYERNDTAAEDDVAEFDLTFPLAFGGTIYTRAAIWGNGYLSFGPATAAQKAFVKTPGAFSNPLGFPGDFVAITRTNAAATMLTYSQINDPAQPFSRDQAGGIMYIGWSDQFFDFSELQAIQSLSIAFSNNGVSLPAGSSYRLGSVQAADINNAVSIATSGGAQTGTANADFLKGFASGDAIDGGGGNDDIRGYNGNDTLTGGGGDDLLIGGDGDDLLRPGAGIDRVLGDAGSDTVSYADDGGAVQVNLSTGQGFANTAQGDTYQNIENAIGGIGNDSLIGSDVANRLEGHNGNDELLGFGGDDVLLPGLGTDTVNGGTGIDTVSYADDLGAVQVNLSSGQGFASAAQGDSYTGIENVEGSSANDSLIGNGVANRLDGRGGNDELLGFDGDDLLIGGAGADALTGGTGIDTASYANDLGAIFVNLTLGQGSGNAAQGDTFSGVENLIGSSSNDFFIGDALANRLDGGGGDDTLLGALGPDALVGGSGTDTASYEDNQGSVFVNLSTGQGFNNSAQGDSYAGVENLIGSLFADFFIGDSGVNRLDGASGDDVLIGGLGPDLLVGGAGSDTASYEENWGAVFVNLTLGQGFGNAAQGDTYQGIENLTGSVFYDTFIGDAAANILDGARGADTLTGAGGADTFVMSTALDGFINVDVITDFTPVDDTIRLSASIFSAAGPAGTLAASAFVTGTAATTAAHRIIYDPSNGQLLYDADGSGAGAAVLFATIGTGLGVTAADFVIG